MLCDAMHLHLLAFGFCLLMCNGLCASPPPLVYAPPPGLPRVVYRDECLLVLDKPSGLLTVPGRGLAHADSLALRVQAVCPDARIVHRLDMATSGLVVMAIGVEMERRLSIAFQQRLVEKNYVAVVSGCLERKRGSVDLPLIADWPNRPRQKVDHVNGKFSFTDYEVLASDALVGVSRVALQPHTGRSHQLRVHMMAIGHPILGDELYADEAGRKGASRLLLHATRLCFPHPLFGESVAFSSAPPF